jgi:hypothetical protein
LNKLRQQAAIYALGETPLHLVNKIEYGEERIAELKAENVTFVTSIEEDFYYNINTWVIS